MNRNKLFSAVLTAVLLFNIFALGSVSAASSDGSAAFELISTAKSADLGGTIYRYKHKLTGADVVYNENDSDTRQFVLGFKTPPIDSKGANHVLEHALFCGSDKYPVKNIMHYIQNGTSSLILNGFTADDCTYYLINTENKTEYYNIMDVYLNGIFHPLFLKDKNIFKQQGIRIEYADGKAQYNGVVYNELRIKNLNTAENSVNFLSDKLYRAIYGDTTPAFSAGGELADIKNLTYEDLLRVYNTFYIPSNSMTYLSGKQDINETLAILDEFFSQNTAKAPDISFEDTKQIPKDKIQEYNIDENTKTVDIGFMFSGVPADAEAKDRYAVEIVYDIIRTKMEDKGYTDMYTSGGNTGGVSNLALMISRVPIENKDKVIADYGDVLNDLTQNGIDDKEIDKYVDNDNRYFYQTFDRIMIGLLYHDDPLSFAETSPMREYYKTHREYFGELLKKYYTENPCGVTVVSGNGSFGSEDSSVSATPEELEKIKRETEEFQKWNDTEDDPAAVGKIPFLTLDEVRTAPVKVTPKYEEENGIKFCFTEKDGEDSEATVYFPLTESDVDFAHLMYEFWQYQADKDGGGFFPSIHPYENANNPDKINPHFNIWIGGDSDKSETLINAVSLLKSEQMWNADDLKEYIDTTPKKIMDSYYDPYYLSGAMKDSALSAGGRFSLYIPANTIVGGSPHYYHFLKNLDTNDMQKIIERLKTTADKMLGEKPAVQYVGDAESYNEFKNTVKELFNDAEETASIELNLPIGYNSAATITNLADANHFMITASYSDYSGKAAVLGNVLTTKYLYPVMRGKHGAYGCSIRFYDGSMTSSVTGLQDIDFAITLWQGMGDFLRNLKMTQNELNSFIISAVQEYDRWDYKESEYGINFALTDKSSERCDEIRNEMLTTTVEDIKGYADFVDKLVSQSRVFAVLGKDAADSAKFDFAYYGNDRTLEITPRLTKNPTDCGLTPNGDLLTRGDAAIAVSLITADRRVPQGENPFTDVADTDLCCDAAVSLFEKGIISGYENNMFMPSQHITRAELAAILSKFIFGGDSELKTQYSDINPNAWYKTSIAKMINAGYINGDGGGIFRPDEYVTKAEAFTIINRMLGE